MSSIRGRLTQQALQSTQGVYERTVTPWRIVRCRVAIDKPDSFVSQFTALAPVQAHLQFSHRVPS